MAHSTTPLGRRSVPPAYADEPPAYGPSVLDDNDDAHSHSGRNNPATMRLLPAGSEDDDSLDAYSSRAEVGGQLRMEDRTSAQRQQYVSTGANALANPYPFVRVSHPTEDTPNRIIRKEPNSSSGLSAFVERLKPSSRKLDSSVSGTPTKSPTKTYAGKPRTLTGKGSRGSKDANDHTVDPPPYERINQTSFPLLVPAPLRLASPRVPAEPKPGPNLDLLCENELFLPKPKAQDRKQLSPIQESKEEHEADKTSSSPAPLSRPTPQRYHPLHHHNSSTSSLPGSRPQSSLGTAPSIRAPASQAETNQFTTRLGSPTRPWTPSRGSEFPRRPPSVSSVNYEPADINGSPRPGTPSSRYGGSPRRPLPPAPLFAGPAPVSGSARGHSIDIGDNEDMSTGNTDDDPFGGNGRTVNSHRDSRSSLRSYGSYMSEDTVVTEDREIMSKVNLDDDEDDIDGYAGLDSKIHYGPAPSGRQNRRGVRPAQMTKKQVKLINGELVLECKIPTILHSFLPRRDDREFTHMRYTAVTCDPDDFTVKGYKLRQNIGSTMRETELLVCVTMYNENEIDFTRTMHGIMRNISHFCSRTKSRTWGKDGWQKIVVCIIADGRQKVHPRTLNALAAMGVYQDGIAKNLVNKKEVTAHVYEYTSQVSLDADLKFKGAEKGIMPCQIIFCMKEHNQKKLNSHRWFFNAFGRALTPNVCILLDVGTKPAPTALYHLWKAFDQDSNVAGAAGEIKAGKGKGYLGLLNPLVASQNFEYKMSNILDKPLESVFGYITVLPGALSAYRYHALQNDETGHGPLSQYFKGEMLHGKNADVFTANMYLAEDRILCWELVAKRGEQWLLKFVKNAVGETDVPDTVPEFISQRRRWLNGAFFAAVYSLIHFRQIWRTDHSIWRKILLHIEFVYQFVSLMFTFFSLANFYITFYFIAGSLADDKQDPFGHNLGIGRIIFTILRYACVLLICLQFILSMGNRPQGAKRMFMTSMVVYAVIMIYTTFAALYTVVSQFRKPQDDQRKNPQLELGNNVFTNVIVSTLSTVGLYFFMSFLYLDPWHMFTSSAQYFALLPSYICTLQVYAFCNTHDVTWGTKGDNVIHTDLGAALTAGQSTVELEMPSEQLDIDSGYDEALRNLRDRLEVEPPKLSDAQMQDDYYRSVRTYMVSVWVICNAVVAMAVSESYNPKVANNAYLAFVLWSVAALAVFRGLGSATFAVMTVVHKIAEGRMKFAGSGSGSSGGSFSSGSSSAVLSHRSMGEKVGDWMSEAKWETKRKLGKLAFWR